MPDEIELQLSHKDVNLGAFREHKKTILSLRSGDTLAYHDYHLSLPSTGTDIGLLSMNMQKKNVAMADERLYGYTGYSALRCGMAAQRGSTQRKRVGNIAYRLENETWFVTSERRIKML